MLLVLTTAVALSGAVLLVAMLRRDAPELGMFGLVLLQLAGAVAAVYGVLAHV